MSEQNAWNKKLNLASTPEEIIRRLNDITWAINVLMATHIPARMKFEDYLMSKYDNRN